MLVGDLGGVGDLAAGGFYGVFRVIMLCRVTHVC